MRIEKLVGTNIFLAFINTAIDHDVIVLFVTLFSATQDKQESMNPLMLARSKTRTQVLAILRYSVGSLLAKLMGKVRLLGLFAHKDEDAYRSEVYLRSLR